MATANTLFETVGNTPLLKLTRVAQEIGSTITATCEFFSPSGSLQDRILVHVVEFEECPTLSERRWRFRKIEGIEDGFIYPVFDVSIPDGVVITTTQESIEMARRLARGTGDFPGIGELQMRRA